MRGLALLPALLPAALAAQTVPLPTAAWPAHVAPGQAAWRGTLDLRRLPADTRAAALAADIDLSSLPPGSGAMLTASANGRVFAHRRLTGGARTAVTLPVEQKLLSISTRFDLAMSCPATPCRADRVRVADVHVTLAPVTAEVTDFARAAVRLRRALAVEVQPGADPALAAHVVAALAPAAPQVADATARIVVGRMPPAGFRLPLAIDGATRLESRAGEPLYAAADLDRLTAVQLLRDGDRIAIWVRPGRAAALPAYVELDHGDVALFGAGRREIAYSSQSDEVIRAVRAAPPGTLDATEMRLIGAALFWLAATGGVLWIASRLPRPAARAEA